MLDRTSVRRFALLSSAALVLGAGLLGRAQDASAPVRAARLTSSQGTVTVVDGNNPAVPAQMNVPLPAGVQIATGQDGQAQIEFEDGSVARLTPNSTLSLDRLDIAPGDLFVTDLSLLRGLAYFELRATPEYTYSVNAGGDVLSPVQNATVRVDFDQPPASFAVLDGSVQVQRTNGFQAQVHAGETLSDELGNPAHYSLTEQIAADSWDQWNADMDQQAAQQASASTGVRDNYAGAQGYGWGDMDADGTWYDVPGQGPIWQPFAAEGDADFDPYGNGAWAWYPGMGYLWASAYPWGWTPYRCGAWSYFDDFGWGWAPDAACGGFGWGFAGGGYVVNIAVAPRGYRPVRVPVGRPGPIRPVLPVHTVAGAGRSPAHVSPPGSRQPRQIAGVTAQPIVPVHTGFAGGGTMGASLRRDFPIDRATHAPAIGVMSSGARPGSGYVRGQSQAPQYARPANGAQTQQSFQGRTRGLQTQHTVPARPAYSAPQSPAHQNYAPAPRYSPPPAHYSPPPAHYSPPPAPHYSPPPPPAPHVSAPPPAAPAHR